MLIYHLSALDAETMRDALSLLDADLVDGDQADPALALRMSDRLVWGSVPLADADRQPVVEQRGDIFVTLAEPGFHVTLGVDDPITDDLLTDWRDMGVVQNPSPLFPRLEAEGEHEIVPAPAVEEAEPVDPDAPATMVVPLPEPEPDPGPATLTVPLPAEADDTGPATMHVPLPEAPADEGPATMTVPPPEAEEPPAAEDDPMAQEGEE